MRDARVRASDLSAVGSSGLERQTLAGEESAGTQRMRRVSRGRFRLLLTAFQVRPCNSNWSPSLRLNPMQVSRERPFGYLSVTGVSTSPVSAAREMRMREAGSKCARPHGEKGGR